MNRTVLLILLLLIAIVAVITLAPGSILLNIKPKYHKHPLPKTFSDGLKPNELLSNAEKLFNDKIHGPESIAIFNNKVYTGTHDGYIYRIDSDTQMTPLVKIINKECPESWNTIKCGRPLGLKFDSKGNLYVTDASHGVFKVDIETSPPKVNKILGLDRTKSLGKESHFFDDIAIHENAGSNNGHIIYISDVSTKFDVSQTMLILGGSDTGRILKYDINADKLSIVAENFYFPNGIELTDDKSAILFAETATRRIFKYYITGEKSGQTEVFIKALPGEPDNIRRSASDKETYWVGLAIARNATNENTMDFIATKPLMRKLIFRTMHLVGNGIETVGSIFNNPVLKELGFDVKTAQILLRNTVEKSYGLVIEIDSNGKIINSLHSPDGTVTMLSEAKEMRINEKETVLYLGSYSNKYLGKIILKR